MKRGFTLIELLAVIVILGIVGLIVTPTLVGYIEKSKVSSYRSSVQTVIDKAKEYVSKTEENNDFPVGGIDITKVDLNLKKANFKNGIIDKDEKGQIYARNVYYGKYCANGTKNNLIIEKVEKLEDCNSVDATPPEFKKIIVNNVTSTSITVVAIASDAQSGIKEYEYCIGDECTKQNKNNYTFKNLKPNTEYEITVKARNSNYGISDQYTNAVTETSKKIKVTTNIVEKPSFKVSSLTYSSSKKVTIIYPKKEEGYVYSYRMVDTTGQLIKEEIINEETKEIIINENCTITATIKVGNEELSDSLTIIGIDGKGPEVTVINPEKWEKVKQLEIRAVDTGSGLAKKAYSYDGGKSWTSNNKRAFQENDKIKILVKDKLGNITNKYKVCKDSEETDCVEVEGEIIIDKIDTENPDCELAVTNGTLGTNGWYRSNVNIGFKSVTDYATDLTGTKIVGGSGVVSQSINTPTITSEGKTTVTGTVVDAVGNKGTCSITVNIDKTNPTCSSSGGSTAWTKGSRTLTGTCADTGGSGCSGNASRLFNSEGSWTNQSPGTVTDRAGNSASCPANQTVRVEKNVSAPTIAGGTTTNDQPITIYVSKASSAVSGIKKYQYCESTSSTSCNNWQDLSSTSVQIKTKGIRYIFFRAVSNANNYSSYSNYQTTTIKVYGQHASCGKEQYNCSSCYTGSNTCKPSYKKCYWYEKLPSVYFFRCTFSSVDKCKNVLGGEAYDPKTDTTYYGCYYMTDPPYSGQFRCTSKKVYKSSSVCGVDNPCATGSNTCAYGCDERDKECWHT